MAVHALTTEVEGRRETEINHRIKLLQLHRTVLRQQLKSSGMLLEFSIWRSVLQNDFVHRQRRRHPNLRIDPPTTAR
jgi:hypothetical protein